MLPRSAHRGRRLAQWAGLLLLLVLCPEIVRADDFVPFGSAELSQDFSLDGQGSNVDSLAFWEAPDPNQSLLFVTAKDNQLVEVWRFPFVASELTPLTHASFGSGTQVNGVAVDQQNDLLYVSVSEPASTVSVFSLPGLQFVGEFLAGSVDLKSEPNVALLRLAGGATRLYVSADDVVYMLDAATGSALGQFTPARALETIAGDPLYQALYIPDEAEQTGVYAYDPNGLPFERAGTNQFGDGGIFQADGEGVLLYTCPSDGSGDDGSGFIVVSDQRTDQTDFEIFDRQSWLHLGALRITGVSNTDGIGSTQLALPGYPLGLFVAIDNDTRTVAVGWDRILAATGLACPPPPYDVALFQQGLDGYLGSLDASIRESQPVDALGELTQVSWDTDTPPGTSLEDDVLIGFADVFGSGPGQIPPGSSVISAELRLEVWNRTLGLAGEIYEVLVPWDETVTWNSFGPDPGIQPEDLGDFLGPAPLAVGPFVLDVTASLQRWSLAPASAYGWLIVPRSTNAARVHSSDYTVQAERPRLQVQFLPPATVCSQDAECDDGLHCNGAETCNAGTCASAAPVDCSDGVACTADSCNEGADSCDHAPDDVACNNGLFCDGIETCDSLLGCQAGPPADCDDGLSCTLDACNEAADACDSTPDDAACDNGLFCDGLESCDALLGCQAGAPVDCDDAVACTLDACNEAADTCDHAPDDAACDDALFCTGAEVCSASIGCQAGASVDCSDGIACTLDTCNEAANTCDHAPDDTACDDALFCTGIESCDVATGCNTGPLPCSAQVCNEGTDSCDAGGGTPTFEEAQSGGSAASASVATSAPLVAAEGHLYLAAISSKPNAVVTGVSGLGLAWTEVRSQCAGRNQTGLAVWAAIGAPSGSGPVSATLNLTAESAVIAVTRYSGVATPAIGDVVSGNTNGVDGACASGVDSPAYSLPLLVSGGSRLYGAAASRNQAHTPGAGYTERVEVTSGSSGGAATAAAQDRLAAAAGVLPVEGALSGNTDWAAIGLELLGGSATGCSFDAQCDDGVSCTVDACDVATGTCTHFADDSSCDNSLFCDGLETCDELGDCVAGTPPDCDDGVGCTLDACVESVDSCGHTPDASACDDGVFCNGVESCDAGLDCQSGSPPCPQVSCDEIQDSCSCGLEEDCDDGVFCNGVELCSNGQCLAGALPNCDDATACTADSCDELSDSCQNVPDDASCDDGLLCNGAEACLSGLGCQPGTAACDDGIACTADSCQEPSGTTCAGPPPGNPGIWISPEEIAGLPTSGAAWQNVLAAADEPVSNPNLSNQDDKSNTSILAKALVWVRTGQASYRDEVLAMFAPASQGGIYETENGGRTLALGRELAAYIVAAELIGLDPTRDAEFRSWLDAVRSETLDGGTLISTHELRPNNWGTMAGVSRIAAAIYLGDAADLDAAALVFKGWLGDRNAYSNFNYNDDLTWQADAQNPVGVNPLGATKEGANIDGVLPEEMRRFGPFAPPPFPQENYAYEGLQGAIAQAVMLSRQGYDVWNWEDQALRRAFQWMHNPDPLGPDFPAQGDDIWLSYLVNYYYGTDFPVQPGPAPGKNFAWTDWTHGGDCAPSNGLVCQNTADDSLCDDGAFCNGTESCDAGLDCQAGTAPCTDLACDEALDVCACTGDEQCDDGLACNGQEVCQGGACSAGTAVDCDDGVACTSDLCDDASGACLHQADDSACDDALYCSGVETCDPVQGCLAGSDPCAGQTCDEGGDVCLGPGVHFGELQSGTASGAGSVSSASLAAAAGDLYLAAISTQPPSAVTQVSGLGLGWTLVRAQCAGDDSTAVELWAAQGTPTAAGGVAASFAGTPGNAVIGVSRYTGVRAAGAIGAVVSGNTNGASGACSGGVDGSAYAFPLALGEANGAAYGAAAMKHRSHTPGSLYLERFEGASGNGSNTASLALADRLAAPAGATTINGSFDARVDWSFVGLEILPQVEP